jgi:hypothetical protein
MLFTAVIHLVEAYGNQYYQRNCRVSAENRDTVADIATGYRLEFE